MADLEGEAEVDGVLEIDSDGEGEKECVGVGEAESVAGIVLSGTNVSGLF